MKKKKKVESDFSDFDGSSEELDEEVDSEDLCDDSTDSDRSWGKRKSKKPAASKGKEVKAARKKKPDGERAFKGKTAKKKPKLSDDDDDDEEQSEDEFGDEVLPKSRRTRGKKLPYLLDDDFDSSDDGIKPGVKRPGKNDQNMVICILMDQYISQFAINSNISRIYRHTTRGASCIH